MKINVDSEEDLKKITTGRKLIFKMREGAEMKAYEERRLGKFNT